MNKALKEEKHNTKEMIAWQSVCDIISFLLSFMIHNHYVITRRFRPTMRFCFAPASFAVVIYRQSVTI